jgi:phosphatidylethanolamine/phosphatidyl-N-methylethanolamine N-methyltransferase
VAEAKRQNTYISSSKRMAFANLATRQLPDYFVFLKGLVSNPRGVSSLTPSSRALATAIAAEVDPRIPGTLIELGAGTGAVTEALIDRGFLPNRIIAIEREPVLAQALRKRCLGVRTYCDDALQFERLLVPSDTLCAVVCGLPILQLPKRLRQSLLSRALARQGSDQRYVQLTYSFLPPIIPTKPDVSLAGHIVWRNFPPAHIWTYRRRSREGSHSIASLSGTREENQ